MTRRKGRKENQVSQHIQLCLSVCLSRLLSSVCSVCLSVAPTWFEMDEDKNCNVYVSNLPLDITEEELLEIMTKCGIIMEDDNGALVDNFHYKTGHLCSLLLLLLPSWRASQCFN